MSQPSEKTQADTKALASTSTSPAAATVNLSVDTKTKQEVEYIAEFYPFDNNQQIDHVKLKEMKEILTSGKCTICKIKLYREDQNQVVDEKIEQEALGILIDLLNGFSNLTKQNLLNHLHTLEVYSIYPIPDSFIQTTTNLPNLKIIVLMDCKNFNEFTLLTLLKIKALKKLRISGVEFNHIYNKEFQDLLQNSLIEELCLLACNLTDAFVENLSRIKTLRKLDLSFNPESLSDQSLHFLAQNSHITELVMLGNAHGLESTVALLEANRIVSITEPFSKYKYDASCGPKKHRISRKYRILEKEECERLDLAFEQNTSLLRVGIIGGVQRYLDDRERWPFSSHSFQAPENEDERRLSTPIEDDMNAHVYRYPQSYVYRPRNLALKEACEAPEVLNHITKTIQALLAGWKVEPAAIYSQTIVSYAKPIGRELLTVFNEETGEQLFRKQLPLLRQFGLYRQSSPSTSSSSSSSSSSSYSSSTAMSGKYNK